MKVLLVCAAGMSTSILMKKMEKYAKEKGFDLTIKAVGIESYQEEVKNYDVLLLGPQILYRLNEIKSQSCIPTNVINPRDYGIGNAENIFKQINEMMK